MDYCPDTMILRCLLWIGKSGIIEAARLNMSISPAAVIQRFIVIDRTRASNEFLHIDSTIPCTRSTPKVGTDNCRFLKSQGHTGTQCTNRLPNPGWRGPADVPFSGLWGGRRPGSPTVFCSAGRAPAGPRRALHRDLDSSALCSGSSAASVLAARYSSYVVVLGESPL
jgi:hypothetical protein